MNVGWIETEKANFKYYYDGISESIAKFLEKIDSERIAVAKAVGFEVESTADWLKRIILVILVFPIGWIRTESLMAAEMDDIEPNNRYSPEIIHVVSYSEALFLATPDILNDSIKITETALSEYRKLKKQGMTPDTMTDEINERARILQSTAAQIVKAMEENIADLYSPEGFYIAFTSGWLSVPELWSDSSEFTWEYSDTPPPKYNRGHVIKSS